MKRLYVNLSVDIAATLLFLGMLATGFLLRFPLPAGTQRSHTLWGLSRHEWGTVHTWISFGLIAVLLLHLALHWRWIVCVVRRRFGRNAESPGATSPGTVRSGVVALLLLAACLALFAWAAYSGVRTEDRPDGEPREPQRLRRGWSE